jgi:hypothetical protein
MKQERQTENPGPTLQNRGRGTLSHLGIYVRATRPSYGRAQLSSETIADGRYLTFVDIVLVRR